MSLGHGAFIVRDNLAIHLDAANSRSYPGSGATWFDLSGNGENFTLYNSPSFSTANKGELIFSGTNDYARITNSALVNSIAANGSIELWFRSNTSVLGAGTARFISIADAAGTGSDVGSTLGANRDYNNFLCIVRKGSSPSEGIALWYKNFPNNFGPTTLVNTQEYFQVATTWSTGTSTMTFRVYINGVRLSSISLSQTGFSNASTITIGQNSAGALTTPQENINCAFSNIKFYSKALSDLEVSQNFNALRGRFGV